MKAMYSLTIFFKYLTEIKKIRRIINTFIYGIKTTTI